MPNTQEIANKTALSEPFISPLEHLGVLRVQGADAQKLLQGQLTCDVNTMTSGSMGAHCNAQGRIISLFYIIYHQASYYLIMPQCMVDIALNALKKYAIFYKVQLENVNAAFTLLGYQAANLPQHILENFPAVTVNTKNQRGILIVDNAHMKSVSESLKIENNITHNKWKYMDMMDGVPTIYPETSEKFLPHEINLDKLNALNFEKGCYTGQEIIARMHYRGKLKNRMFLTTIQSTVPPLPGKDITILIDEHIQAAGSVIDYAELESDRYVTLITTDVNNVKTSLFLEHNPNAELTFLNNEDNS